MNKKEIKTYTVGNLFKLKWAGGGEIPVALSGAYTSAHNALDAAKEYLATRRNRSGAKRAEG